MVVDLTKLPDTILEKFIKWQNEAVDEENKRAENTK